VSEDDVRKKAGLRERIRKMFAEDTCEGEASESGA